MKKPLLTPPQYSDEAKTKGKKEYQFGLMHHQEEPNSQLVFKINHIVAGNLSSTKMLDEIAQLLGLAFKVDGCCLVTVDPQRLSNPITANWCDDGEYAGLPLGDKEQLDLPVVECASEPTIEDISTIEKCLVIGVEYLQLPIKSVLAITTKFAGSNNGVIILIKSQIYHWSDWEKQLLKQVESSCAIAYSQVSQAQLISQQKQDLQKSTQHQGLIEQLTIVSRSNLELNQMLQLVVTSTAQAMDADRGLLILLKYTDPLLRNKSTIELTKVKANVVSEWSKDPDICAVTQADTPSFLISDCGLCQRAFIASGKPVIVNDNTVRRRDNSNISPVFAIDKLPATLIMPLEGQGKVLGFMVLQQSVPRTWQSAELNIVGMVCAQLTSAIIQTHSLRQVQSVVDERTAQLQRSLEVQAKLYEIKQQHVKQLQELNQYKDEFVSNLSDRLRYPLTNMRMALRNLRQPEITPQRQSRYLDILEVECTKEINLINDLLTLQKLETHQTKPQFESIDLNRKILELVADFEPKLVDRGLSIASNLPPEPLTLQTEIESFDRILLELLTNAGKYSVPDTTVELQAYHQVNKQIDKIIIQVTNVGRGISEEEATYIFDKFRRGKGRWTPGTGLGLALVKSLVQHLNGDILVESTPIEDSEVSQVCFTLTLPQSCDDSIKYSDE